MNQQPESSERHGHCLCGAVKLTAKSEKPTIGVCHCGICRRWGGGPTMETVTHEVPRFEGQEHIGIYGSSEWAERAFCKNCGSHLFYRLKDESVYSLSAGLFDDSRNWPFELQVFIDEKPANYEFANDTKKMSGAEVFAMFSAS